MAPQFKMQAQQLPGGGGSINSAQLTGTFAETHGQPLTPALGGSARFCTHKIPIAPSQASATAGLKVSQTFQQPGGGGVTWKLPSLDDLVVLQLFARLQW